MLQPTAIVLQGAFLLVLFLFVAWVVRSTLRDLRRPDEQRVAGPPPADATGIHSALTAGAAPSGPGDPRLVVERAPGHTPGMEVGVDRRRNSRGLPDECHGGGQASNPLVQRDRNGS